MDILFPSPFQALIPPGPMCLGTQRSRTPVRRNGGAMHRLSKKVVFLVSHVMLGVLLYSQLAIAVQACIVPAMSPAMAFDAEPASKPCHGINGNLCLAQSLQSDQTVNSNPPLTMNAPSSVTLVTDLVVAPLPRRQGPRALLVAYHPDPPICIQLCRFLF